MKRVSMNNARMHRFVLAHLLTVVGEWAAIVGILVHAYRWGGSSAVGFVALAATVADLLWPLSDPRRQALHDKVADTQVVVGHQKR